MKTTMIQIKKETAMLLKDRKEYNRQSYDEIINDLLQNVNSEAITEKEAQDIREALQDVAAGKFSSIGEVAKRLGIDLKA